LSARYTPAAALAKLYIIERIPEMEFIEIAQRVEFIFRPELEGSDSGHASYTHSAAKPPQSVNKPLQA